MKILLVLIIGLILLISPCFCLGAESSAIYYLNENALISSNSGIGTVSITDASRVGSSSQFVVRYESDIVSTGFSSISTPVMMGPQKIDFSFLLYDTENNVYQPINTHSKVSISGMTRVLDSGSVDFSVPLNAKPYYITVVYDQFEWTGKKSVLIMLKESWRPHYNNAMKLLNETKYSEAINEIDQALEIVPNSSALFYTRGYIYYSNNSFSLAALDFEKAIEQEPEAAMPYFYLGESYENLGEQTKAVDAYTQYLSYAPNNTTVQTDLDRINLVKQRIHNLNNKQMDKNRTIPGFSAFLSIMGLILCIILFNSRSR